VKRLLVMGAGGHGKVVAESAASSFAELELAFLDMRYPKLSTVMKWPVIGRDSDALSFVSDYRHIVVAFGDNRLRLERIRELTNVGFEFPPVIHATHG
jgi:hypothetical protein